MNYYETLYIIHPAIESGRLKDTIVSVQKQIEKNQENKTLCTEIWGKKKLAYLIEKQKYGTYVLIQYSGDGTQINSFNIEMKQNPNILSYMTVKIKESEIKEQTEDIDTQISGNEKEGKLEKVEQETKPETPPTEKPPEPVKNIEDSKTNKEDLVSEGIKILETPTDPIEESEEDKEDTKEVPTDSTEGVEGQEETPDNLEQDINKTETDVESKK